MSADKTCSISGLGIPSGTPVRLFLLTKNPYEDYVGSRAVYPHHWWVPRTFPLKATNDDYGRVRDVTKGFQRDLWLQGFKQDLVSREASDRDDVAVAPGMPFDRLMEALAVGRVSVHRSTEEREILPVSVGMIREDVWQAMLKLPVASPWSSSDPDSIDAYRKDIRRIYAWALKNREDDARALAGGKVSKDAKWAVEYKDTPELKAIALKQLRRSQFGLMAFNRPKDEPTSLSFMVGKDEVPYTAGPSTHFQLFCELGLPMEEAEPFLDVVAEFAFIHLAAMLTRHMWVPSSSSGPSGGYYDTDVAYLSAMLEIAKKEAAEWHKDNADTLEIVNKTRRKKKG